MDILDSTLEELSSQSQRDECALRLAQEVIKDSVAYDSRAIELARQIAESMSNKREFASSIQHTLDMLDTRSEEVKQYDEYLRENSMLTKACKKTAEETKRFIDEYRPKHALSDVAEEPREGGETETPSSSKGT